MFKISVQTNKHNKNKNQVKMEFLLIFKNYKECWEKVYNTVYIMHYALHVDIAVFITLCTYACAYPYPYAYALCHFFIIIRLCKK